MRSLLLSGACCVLVQSCSSSPAKQDSGPWAREIAKSAAQASSSFEKQVFADGKITRSEYEEAVHRNVSCLNAHGLDISTVSQPDGTYGYSFPGQMDSTTNNLMNICGHGTVELIEPLYKGIVQNPKNVNPADAMAECMRRKHKAPANFTGQQMQALLDKYQDPAKFPTSAPVNGKDPVVAECMQPPYS